MNNYNFSTLNDKEFEQIARDLLNAKFSFGLQSFKAGKDKGIDLRRSTPKNNNAFIVQAKHYINSGFVKLKSVLKKEELPKLQKLKPDRYLIVTSLPLTANQKDELRAVMSPYILSSNDVIGQEDLNAYLAEHKDVEKQYFKLWFSSVTVFETILRNAVEGRTKYMLAQIAKKSQFYVITRQIDEAIKILQREKVLLITGQPGIGKTTLAEIILFARAKNGQKIHKVENIAEAEDVMSASDDEHQLFYFDDFLGANYSEIVNAATTETQLTSFIERVKNTPNKLIILTTRTVILTRAKEKFEKIGRAAFSGRGFELTLEDYSKYEKALILYNHLYFKQIKPAFYEIFLHAGFYKKIIEHPNYTPRIIEFMTENSRIEQFDSKQYLQFIINNLNNPKEIWRYSFNNQIDYLSRCLLLTLFTFDRTCSEQDLIEAFEIRLQYEKTHHNQIVSANQFQETIKILLNGFIVSTIHDVRNPLREYSFINPSLADFIICHVKESYQERKAILSSIVFIEQLKRFDPDTLRLPIDEGLQEIIFDRLTSGSIHLKDKKNKIIAGHRRAAILLEAFCKYCPQQDIDELLLENFQQLDRKEFSFDIRKKVWYVLLHLPDLPKTFEYIKNHFEQISDMAIGYSTLAADVREIPKVFKRYGQNFTEYGASENGYEVLIDTIEKVLHNLRDHLSWGIEETISIMSEAIEIHDELILVEKDLLAAVFPGQQIHHDFDIDIDRQFWEDKINENIQRAKKDELDAGNYDEDYYHSEQFDKFNEDRAIEDLFTKSG